ncbi:MAG: nucleotidyltransferase domain-containing protein [Endomicrobium sp.]|jgi:predicted nucleotidyltransferase|nr:nucleotidyltransferase domain-containing protein [Endomicrobium sp.]
MAKTKTAKFRSKNEVLYEGRNTDASIRDTSLKEACRETKGSGRYLEKVIAKLKSTVSPYKIVLFGSYAKGNAKPDSDIDLMVILDTDYLPKDYDDMMRIHTGVRDIIRYDRYKYDMDLKVFARAEYKKLKDRDSFFVWEVEHTGETIYEK